jgi:hypothetical protein
MSDVEGVFNRVGILLLAVTFIIDNYDIYQPNSEVQYWHKRDLHWPTTNPTVYHKGVMYSMWELNCIIYPKRLPANSTVSVGI